MLVMTGIFLLAACVLIGTYTVMTARCKQQLASIGQEVRAETDAKTKASLELDSVLSKRLADGKSTAATIDQWQVARAEILKYGRTCQPWAWTAEELNAWARDRVREMGDEIRRRFCVAFILATVTLVLITGVTGVVFYHFYSAQRLPANPAAFDSTGYEVPGGSADPFSRD